MNNKDRKKYSTESTLPWKMECGLKSRITKENSMLLLCAPREIPCALCEPPLRPLRTPLRSLRSNSFRNPSRSLRLSLANPFAPIAKSLAPLAVKFFTKPFALLAVILRLYFANPFASFAFFPATCYHFSSSLASFKTSSTK